MPKPKHHKAGRKRLPSLLEGFIPQRQHDWTVQAREDAHERRQELDYLAMRQTNSQGHTLHRNDAGAAMLHHSNQDTAYPLHDYQNLSDNTIHSTQEETGVYSHLPSHQLQLGAGTFRADGPPYRSAGGANREYPDGYESSGEEGEYSSQHHGTSLAGNRPHGHSRQPSYETLAGPPRFQQGGNAEHFTRDYHSSAYDPRWDGTSTFQPQRRASDVRPQTGQEQSYGALMRLPTVSYPLPGPGRQPRASSPNSFHDTHQRETTYRQQGSPPRIHSREPSHLLRHTSSSSRHSDQNYQDPRRNYQDPRTQPQTVFHTQAGHVGIEVRSYGSAGATVDYSTRRVRPTSRRRAASIESDTSRASTPSDPWARGSSGNRVPRGRQ